MTQQILDRVLTVERVSATAPATGGVGELASSDADVATRQTGPSLGSTLGVEEMLLTLLSELSIGLVTSEITQASPLKDESAHLGETTAGGAGLAVHGVEEDLAIGNTAGGIESDGESVGKAGGLLEKGIDLLGVASEALVRALEQVVACALVLVLRFHCNS